MPLDREGTILVRMKHEIQSARLSFSSTTRSWAPDYPGFGNSDLPDAAKFPYTFDKLAEVTEKFLKQEGFDRFGLFMQDYGGPVGFRIISRHPEWAEWLIIQNTNAYVEGFTSAWDAIRNALWQNRGPETEAPLMPFLAIDGIRMVYLHGHKHPELISPDNWLDLFYDYRTNVAVAEVPA